MKLNIILALLLSIAMIIANYYNKRAGEAEHQLRLSLQNRQELITHIRRIYDEKIILEQNNAILETSAKEDMAFFDWYADISNTAVIKRLQSQ